MPLFSFFGGGDEKNNNNNKNTVAAAPPPPPPPPPPAANTAATVSTASASIESIKQTIDILDRKNDQLEQDIKAAETEAKGFMAAGKKNMALQCMKRVQLYKTQIDNMLQQRFNLETTLMHLENQAVQAAVFRATQQATSALVAGNAQMDPEKVQDLMDTLQQAVQDQQDATNAMAQPLSPVDEDDAEEALMALMKGEQQKKVAVAPPVAAATQQRSAVGVVAAAAASVPKKSAADLAAEAELAKLMGTSVVPSDPIPTAHNGTHVEIKSEEEELLAQLELC